MPKTATKTPFGNLSSFEYNSSWLIIIFVGAAKIDAIIMWTNWVPLFKQYRSFGLMERTLGQINVSQQVK